MRRSTSSSGPSVTPAGARRYRSCASAVRACTGERENLDYTVPDGFAGSILNLQPGTEYECRFELTDPDGASGQTSHTVRVKNSNRAAAVRRRAVPSMSIRPTIKGRVRNPASPVCSQAYYGAGLGDWSVVWERRAQPGDVILMHAGLYKAGAAELRRPADDAVRRLDVADARRERSKSPITIAAAGDGEVIFDGAGNHRLFDVMASQHHIFDGLTIRNTDVAIFAGQKECLGRGRPDGQELPLRERRLRSLDRVRRVERLLHRRQPVSRPRRPLSADRLDRPAVGERRTVRFAFADELLCDQGLWPWARHRPQRDRLLPRRHRHLHLRNAGAGPGPPRVVDRHLQQRHAHVERRLRRDRRRRSQRPRLEQPRRQRRAGRLQRSTRLWRAGVLHRQHLYHVPSGVAFKFSAKPAGLFVYHNTIIGEQTARDPSANMHFRNNLFLGRDTPDRGDHDLGECDAGIQLRLTTGIVRITASLRSTPGSRPQPGSSVRTEARRLEELWHVGATSELRPARKRTASKSISTSSSD